MGLTDDDKRTLKQLIQEFLEKTGDQYEEPEIQMLRTKIRNILFKPPDENLMKIIRDFIDIPASIPEEFNKFVERMEFYTEEKVEQKVRETKKGITDKELFKILIQAYGPRGCVYSFPYDEGHPWRLRMAINKFFGREEGEMENLVGYDGK